MASFSAWIVAAICAATPAGEPSLTPTKYLVLDGRVIDHVENAVLRVGKVAKHPANPLFGQEFPWEARFDNFYPNVFFDEEEQVYKLWYFTFTVDPAVAETPPEQRTPGAYMRTLNAIAHRASNPAHRDDGLGYAISKDGIHWEKPLMTVCPWLGKPSNLVANPCHGAGVFKDLREPDPSRRYKMLLMLAKKGMGVCFSADGIHWGEPLACPQIDAAGDTHNNAFWAPELHKYVGITRLWGGEPTQRLVGRTESSDFVTWTKAVDVFRGDVRNQIYAMPVVRYAGVYLGFPVIFSNPQSGGDDRTHTELAWSPDTTTWNRIEPGTALVPNAAQKGGDDWGTTYAGLPIFLKNEIRIYYGGCNGPHTDWREGFLMLATLRPDGFAAYEPQEANKPCLIVSKALACGTELQVSADADGGMIAVSLVDEMGNRLAESEPVTTNVTDHAVSWKNHVDLKTFVGKNVVLHWEVRNAKLYAFAL